jgi:TetR/AcrR family transcriptional repressor of nem operon
MAENRRTILDAAGRLFRERGFDSVTVAEVMQAAGLTHGGFYGYFKSKDELIAGALADVLTKRPEPSGDLAAFAAGYLSQTHRDDRATGCPTAALAAETVNHRRQAAIGSWAAMVGAMILARVSNDPALSSEVLDQTQAWLAAKANDHV